MWRYEACGLEVVAWRLWSGMYGLRAAAPLTFLGVGCAALGLLFPIACERDPLRGPKVQIFVKNLRAECLTLNVGI